MRKSDNEPYASELVNMLAKKWLATLLPMQKQLDVSSLPDGIYLLNLKQITRWYLPDCL